MEPEKDLVEQALRRCLDLGSTYCEVRLHSVSELGVLLRDGEPEPTALEKSYGIAIRVLVNGALGFGATNSLDRPALEELCEEVVKRAKASAPLVERHIALSEERMERASWRAEERKRVENVGNEDMLSLLKELDGILKEEREVRFPQRLLHLGWSVEEKYLVNSDGANLSSRVPRVYFSSFLTVEHEGKARSVSIPAGYAQLGGSGGWEVVEDWRLEEYLREEADELSRIIARSRAPTEGKVDVVVGPEIVGLMAHESVGHPSEADRILGREGAQAGESYLKPQDRGRRIGSEEATVVDDPSLQGSLGFYLYDDEGVKSRKRYLMKAGVVEEFLHNRSTAKELGLNSNAAARAVAFDREPIVRMANTFVEPGDYSFEELLEGISEGVYLRSFMEWNIDDKRINQRYVALHAYRIERGEIKEPLRDVILELTTQRLWSSLDARGKDLRFMGATCGKGEPMQGAPVWTGGPSIRLRGIRVRGL